MDKDLNRIVEVIANAAVTLLVFRFACWIIPILGRIMHATK
jgi:hypothetical protein